MKRDYNYGEVIYVGNCNKKNIEYLSNLLNRHITPFKNLEDSIKYLNQKKCQKNI